MDDILTLPSFDTIFLDDIDFFNLGILSSMSSSMIATQEVVMHNLISQLKLHVIIIFLLYKV